MLVHHANIVHYVTTPCQFVHYVSTLCQYCPLCQRTPSLSLELTKSAILPELHELSVDEEVGVRMSAIETLTELLSFLDEETQRSMVLPLVQKFAEQAMGTRDKSLPVVARLLGRLCHELKGVSHAY